MIVFGVTWYFMIWKGASVFNLEREPIPGLWLIYFFNIDTVALITIVMVLLHKSFFWEHRKFVVVLLVAYLLTTVLLGSRGGAVRIGWIIGIFMLTYAGNFRLSIRQALGFCLSVIVVGVLLYPVGTLARHVRAGLLREGPGFVRVVTGAWGLGRGLNKVEEGSTKPRELSVPERVASFAIWSWGPAKLLPHLLGKIVNRIGVLDYVVEILSDRGNRAQLKRYMNIEYAVKSFLNSTVLGTPFPEAEIKTSRVMPIVYRERNEDHLRRNFLSEPWTVWGLGYAFFGGLGGLGAIFILAFLVQIGFLAIMKFGGPYKYYAGTYYLFGSTLAGFLLNMGVDHWLIIVFYFFLSSVVTFALLYGTFHGIRWARSFSSPG